MKINEAKEFLNKSNKDKPKLIGTPGFGWEIGAYSIRAVSVLIPVLVIMALENSWVKSGLGLLATLLIVAMLIIFRKPLGHAAGYAPGVIPFSIFIVIATFFNTTAKSLLIVGTSGLAGSVLAIPLHIKYLRYQKAEKSPELLALEALTSKIK